MSFLFGGGGSSSARTPSFTPRATPATPRISSGAGETAVREERRRRNRSGQEEDTILTGLGSVGAQGSKVQRSTLLGSAAGA